MISSQALAQLWLMVNNVFISTTLSHYFGDKILLFFSITIVGFCQQISGILKIAGSLQFFNLTILLTQTCYFHENRGISMINQWDLKNSRILLFFKSHYFVDKIPIFFLKLVRYCQ